MFIELHISTTSGIGNLAVCSHRGQGNIHTIFSCSADHEQDWQPYPVDPYSAICDDHTYISSPRTSLWLPFPPTKPRAVVRRPRGWHGQPGVALTSANCRFRGSASSSLASATLISTAACSREDKGASHAQSHTATSLSMGMAMATRPSGPEGVEWAGWECKFSGVDGKRTAVPEDYVPESLREWDVEV